MSANDPKRTVDLAAAYEARTAKYVKAAEIDRVKDFVDAAAIAAGSAARYAVSFPGMGPP